MGINKQNKDTRVKSKGVTMDHFVSKKVKGSCLPKFYKFILMIKS